ncbi:hypothetical protein ACFVYD_00435 [Streptomyces sp. NPDC058301]|uniref:hypothetical protein n=1 Tax=Streptomyces sp. NPDC058301 TaxID=3346436 RepID=UPI0036E19C1D
MHLVWRRVCAVAALLLGVTLGLWIAFGAPHEWEGALGLLRLALGMTTLALIIGGVRLMFPGAAQNTISTPEPLDL